MENRIQEQYEAEGTNAALVALCTCSNEVEAQSLARGLVQEGLAACVNVLPPVRSIYRWRDEICEEAETLIIIKTSQHAAGTMQTWLEQQHSYEVPEILFLPIAQGLPAYLDWLLKETGPKNLGENK